MFSRLLSFSLFTILKPIPQSVNLNWVQSYRNDKAFLLIFESLKYDFRTCHIFEKRQCFQIGLLFYTLLDLTSSIPFLTSLCVYATKHNMIFFTLLFANDCKILKIKVQYQCSRYNLFKSFFLLDFQLSSCSSACNFCSSVQS